MYTNNYGFPHSTNHQLIVDMANSAKKTISCLRYLEVRTDPIDQQFQKRIHELMRYRSHTVNTDI